MILGVIPARGGSKGIPRKNIHPVAGKPLLAWTVEAARSAKLLDRFVVSTEDEEIARAAKEHGADLLRRPAELSSDAASTLAVLQHALSQIPADTIVVLQPTSPVRDPGLIDRCIEQFRKSGADSLATGFICKTQKYGETETRRQDVSGFFSDDGNLYVIRAELLRGGDRYGKKIEQVVLDREQNLDIDDPFDLWVAEQVLLRRAKEAGAAR